MKKIIAMCIALFACTQVMAWDIIAEKRTDSSYGGYYFSNRPCPDHIGYIAVKMAGKGEPSSGSHAYCWSVSGKTVVMQGAGTSAVLPTSELKPIGEKAPIHLLIEMRVINQ